MRLGRFDGPFFLGIRGGHARPRRNKKQTVPLAVRVLVCPFLWLLVPWLCDESTGLQVRARFSSKLQCVCVRVDRCSSTARDIDCAVEVLLQAFEGGTWHGRRGRPGSELD